MPDIGWYLKIFTFFGEAARQHFSRPTPYRLCPTLETICILVALALFPSMGLAQTIVLNASNNVFRAQVVLNGQLTAPALIDTGASSVGLCSEMAQLLRLTPRENVNIETSAGAVMGQRVRLDSLKLGPIVLRDVVAVVHPPGPWCTEILVGLSGLRKLSAMILRGRRLVLIGKRKSARPRYR